MVKNMKNPGRQSKSIPNKPALQDMPKKLWKARIVSTNDFEFCLPPVNMEVTRGDFVVISTLYGMDLACILGPVSSPDSVETASVRRIIRIASERDFSKRRSLEKLEKKAFEICHEKIFELKLAMKLITSHYSLDGRKILFFFTAENRIDFRELVKLLVAHLKKRVELRQVGARDETRVIGGVAICGRLYCCHSITDQLTAVSIKMVKDQNIPFNVSKTTGPCNRLLCCLSYELEHYIGEKKSLPRKGARIVHEGTVYRVTDVNILSRMIQLSASEGHRMCVSASGITQKAGGGWKIQSDKLNNSAPGSEGV